MSTSTAVNRRILFARWPAGAPVPEDFKTVNEPLPTANLGQVLLRTLYLSLDPYMRGRMTPGSSYVEPMALGDTMCGQTVCRVLQSHDGNFTAGDLEARLSSSSGVAPRAHSAFKLTRIMDGKSCIDAERASPGAPGGPHFS